MVDSIMVAVGFMRVVSDVMGCLFVPMVVAVVDSVVVAVELMRIVSVVVECLFVVVVVDVDSFMVAVELAPVVNVVEEAKKSVQPSLSKPVWQRHA